MSSLAPSCGQHTKTSHVKLGPKLWPAYQAITCQAWPQAVDFTEKLWGPVASLVKTGGLLGEDGELHHQHWTGRFWERRRRRRRSWRGQSDRLGLSGGHWVDELLQFAAWQSLQRFFETLNKSKIDFLFRRLQTSQLLATQVKSMQVDRDDPTM